MQALAKLGSPAVMLEWLTDLDNATKIPGVADRTKCKAIAALGLDQEQLRIMPEGCRCSSYTPNGGFVAAADKLAIEYLEGVAKDGD